MALSASITAPVYEVREVSEGEPPLDLGVRHRTHDYLNAIEFVFSYLESVDPEREGVVDAVQIVRVSGGEREEVWRYSSSEASQVGELDLVRLWGFDPTKAWRAP